MIATSRRTPTAPTTRGSRSVETEAGGGVEFSEVATARAGDRPPQTIDARSRQLAVTAGRRRAAGLVGPRDAGRLLVGSHPGGGWGPKGGKPLQKKGRESWRP